MLRNLVSAAFLVLSVTATAQAETVQKMQVAIGDLNLDRPAGQAAAQERIHAAAVRLCSSVRSTADVSVRSTADLRGLANLRAVSDRDCIARAVERANAQIANARMR